MALASTTIAAAITAEATQFNVTSATGFAAGNWLRVNDEFMYVHAISSTTVTVQRGRLGTLARAHGILSIAVTGLPSEFADAAEYTPRMYTYGSAAPAITPRPGIHRFAYAGATAATLAAPAYDMEGQELTFVSTNAQAHVITLDSGYFNGATNNIATWGGAIGDVLKVIVIGGSYCVTLAKNVTLSA